MWIFIFNLVTITPSSNTINYQVADSTDVIQVHCTIRQNSNITVNRWYKDGTLLNVTSDNRITTVPGSSIATLKIRNLRISDSGHYQCGTSDGGISLRSGYFDVLSKHSYNFDVMHYTYYRITLVVQ